MIRKTIPLVILLSLNFTFLQQLKAQQAERCATDIIHKRLLQQSTDYRLKRAALEAEIQKNLRKYKTQPSTAAAFLYTIPVVVHVMHRSGVSVGTDENISDQQIQSAITALNEDFRKVANSNGDGNGVDIEVEFCLASKDPDGNIHSGINRINASPANGYDTYGISTGSQNPENDSLVKALSYWDRTKYYNIYVVWKIDGSNQAGTQGYAYFPGAGDHKDGCVILYNAFGTTGTLKYYTDKNRTLTHEMGHALNLHHTFNGDDANDDGTADQCPSDADCGTNGDCVSDTPPHKRSDSDCDSSGTNTCTGGSKSLYVNNYMDYSSGDCQNMFTQGQKDRMRAVLEAVGIGSRKSLIQDSTLLASGCNGEVPPQADFTAINTVVCVGDTVSFMDLSSRFPETWEWTFESGIPATSSDQHPQLVYTSAGTYEVKLVTGNQWGEDSVVKAGYITIEAASSPTGTGDAICAGQTASLSASGGSAIKWYNAKTGGNEVGAGASFTSPALSATTTYYIQDKPAATPQKVGRTIDLNNPKVALYGDIGHGMVFDADAPLIINSVQVFTNPDMSGNRTIELYNNSGSLLHSKVVNIPGGYINRIDLDLKVDAGTGYKIILAAGAGMLGETDTVSSPFTFPYTVNNLISITGSTAGTGYFLFFYDWEAEEILCPSERIPVVATVNERPGLSVTATSLLCKDECIGEVEISPTGSAPFTYTWSNNHNDSLLSGMCAGSYSITVTDSNGCSSDTTITLTEPEQLSVSINSSNDSATANITGGTAPFFYTWSDPDGQATQMATGLTSGEYCVTVVDSNNCQDTACFTLTPVSIPGSGHIISVDLFPNPVKQDLQLKVALPEASNISIGIYDPLGKQVYSISESISEKNYHFDCSEYPPGIYFLKLTSGQTTRKFKFMVVD